MPRAVQQQLRGLDIDMRIAIVTGLVACFENVWKLRIGTACSGSEALHPIFGMHRLILLIAYNIAKINRILFSDLLGSSMQE